MRKILIGVVSVAGLLAVVLALASSPASAEKEVVTVNSATEAGVYTFTWSTKGACDPGSGTSGASGSGTLTVVDADGAGSGTTGTAQETGVVIEKDCTYEWTASLVKANGDRCKANWGDSPPADDAEERTINVGACNVVEKVTFTVSGYTTPCVNNTTGDGDGGSPDCTDTATNTTTQLTADVAPQGPSDDVKSAVKETTFTVTAVEKVPTGQQPDEECATVSGQTSVNDAGVTQVELALTDATLNGRACVFTVTAELPPGFDVGEKGSNSRTVNMDGSTDDGNQPAVIEPKNKDLDTGTPTDTLDAHGERALEVTIASRTVHLVQNVIGDAGGANASYKYDAPCGAPGLPGALGVRKDTGGIQTQAGSTIVELREGRFRVTGAIPADGQTQADAAANGRAATALNKKGEACTATVSLSGVPAGCSADASQSVDLATSAATTIIEFTIDCTPAPEPEAPAADGGDMMDDGADDGGGDMMDDGADDGPKMDAPTG